MEDRAAGRNSGVAWRELGLAFAYEQLDIRRGETREPWFVQLGAISTDVRYANELRLDGSEDRIIEARRADHRMDRANRRHD